MKIENIIIEFLKGNEITISKKGYASTTFKYENNKVYYNNYYISCGVFIEHNCNFIDIQKHFLNMFNENYTFSIKEI